MLIRLTVPEAIAHAERHAIGDAVKSPVSLDTQVFMGIDPSSSMIIFNVSADTCVDACTQTPDANTDLNCASQLTA